MWARETKKIEHPLAIEIGKADSVHDNAKIECLSERYKALTIAEREAAPEILCSLLASTQGRALFFIDQQLRQALTIKELNLPDLHKRQALLFILSDKQGLELLDRDEEFRRKITAEGFCLMNERGQIPAKLMIRQTPGLEVLIKHAELRALLTPAFLNNRTDAKGMPDASPVFEMARTMQGRVILADPVVRKKISKKGLNYTSVWNSAVAYIARSAESETFFADDGFRRKIQAHTLNAIDANKNSVVSHWCTTESGLELLLRYPDLRNKISGATFNAHLRYDTSPVFHLASSESGIKVLASSRYLRGLITLNGMNDTCRYGDNKGASALLLLLSSDAGRDLLMSDRRLRALIEPKDLYISFDGGSRAGVAVVDYLLMPECAMLLKKLSLEVREDVNKVRSERATQTISPRLSRHGLFGWQESAVSLENLQCDKKPANTIL